MNVPIRFYVVSEEVTVNLSFFIDGVELTTGLIKISQDADMDISIPSFIENPVLTNNIVKLKTKVGPEFVYTIKDFKGKEMKKVSYVGLGFYYTVNDMCSFPRGYF